MEAIVVDFTVRAAAPTDAEILAKMLSELLATESIPHFIAEERLRRALAPHLELKCTTLLGAERLEVIDSEMGCYNTLFQILGPELRFVERRPVLSAVIEKVYLRDVLEATEAEI